MKTKLNKLSAIEVSGKLYVDRRYFSLKLTEIVFLDDIHFVARMRNDMKGEELP